MKKTPLFLVFVFLLISFTLSSSLVAQELSDPEKNFEALWKLLDCNYGIFIPKKVDWDLLYRVYRPKVTPQTTDDELFDIMSAMLKHLNDNHVKLISEMQQMPRAGILGDLTKKGEFNLDLIKEKYLKGKFKQRVIDKDRPTHAFVFGWITDEIGYFQFWGFSNVDASAAIVDEVINEFKDAKGMILDQRDSPGGSDIVAKAIAARFADRRRLYMYSHIRNGPNQDDFTPPRYWYVEPDGPMQFTKPIVLLTSRFSISAADCFALAMKVLPHITNVGTATSGAYSDSYSDKLPNGWRVVMAYKLYFDHEGRGWEGIGVPADLRVINTKEDIEQGRDRVLELAIDMLNSGPIKLQDESTSIQPRESLANTLGKTIDSIGIDAAIKLFYQTKAGDPAYYYIDLQELDMLGKRLEAQNKMREAIEVFKVNVNEHPLYYSVYHSLAAAYQKSSDMKLTKINYLKSMELNPLSYPWEKRDYETAKEFIKKERQ